MFGEFGATGCTCLLFFIPTAHAIATEVERIGNRQIYEANLPSQ
jgi:hypothetical protein